jgi:hypothetical protein
MTRMAQRENASHDEPTAGAGLTDRQPHPLTARVSRGLIHRA